jgi:hypothetical protein
MSMQTLGEILLNEGDCINLSSEEISKLSRPLSSDELRFQDRCLMAIKNTNMKDKIYAQFDQYGSIRCREAWELYRGAFLKYLNSNGSRRPNAKF